MPKTRQEKEAIVTELIDAVKRAKGMLFVDFRGLNAKGTSALRRTSRKENIGYLVAKKTLMKRAFEQAGLAGIDPAPLEGSVGIVFGYEDEVAPARVMTKFAKEFDAVKVLAGILEGRMIDTKAVKSLAALPSKTELLGKLVLTLQAPVSGFVQVLSGNLRGLITALAAIKDQKAQSAG